MLSNILSLSRNSAPRSLKMHKLKFKLGLLFYSSRLNLSQFIFYLFTELDQFVFRKMPQLYNPRN